MAPPPIATSSSPYSTSNNTNSTNNTRITVKCIVIGDGAVGKTCLLISYAKGEFPRDYVPTVFDNFAVNVDVAGESITLNLLDTAGQEDYDRLRPLSYSNADIFLLCFSISNRSSFENIRDKWYPELKKHSPDTPFILVGTQGDKRSPSPSSSSSFPSSNNGHLSNNSSNQSKLVLLSEANGLANLLGAIGYVECSAITRDKLRDVFVLAITTSLAHRRKSKKNKKKCIIF